MKEREWETNRDFKKFLNSAFALLQDLGGTKRKHIGLCLFGVLRWGHVGSGSYKGYFINPRASPGEAGGTATIEGLALGVVRCG